MLRKIILVLCLLPAVVIYIVMLVLLVILDWMLADQFHITFNIEQKQ